MGKTFQLTYAVDVRPMRVGIGVSVIAPRVCGIGEHEAIAACGYGIGGRWIYSIPDRAVRSMKAWDWWVHRFIFGIGVVRYQVLEKP